MTSISSLRVYLNRLFDARALRGVEKCNPHLWSVSPGKPANPSSKIIRIEKRWKERIYLAFSFFFLPSPFLCSNESSMSLSREFFRSYSRAFFLSRSLCRKTRSLRFIRTWTHSEGLQLTYVRFSWGEQRGTRARAIADDSTLMHRSRGRTLEERKKYKVA